MNKRFEDARYHLNRAFGTAKRGVRTELKPIRKRLQSLLGREPEPGRLEKAQNRLDALEARAEGGARRAIASAKGRVKSYRK